MFHFDFFRRKISIFVVAKVRLTKKIFFLLAVVAFFATPKTVKAQFPYIEAVTPSICALGKLTVKIVDCTNCHSFEWRIDGGAWVGGGSVYSALVTTPGTVDVECKYIVGGNTGYLKLSKAVIVRKNPTPKIWLSHKRLCAAIDTVTIIDTTANIASRYWIIENAKISPGPKRLKNLFSSNAGLKTIALYVIDSFGCSGNGAADSFGVFVPVKVAVIPKNPSGCVPKKVEYQLVMDSSGQNIKNALWTFENGTPATQTKINPDSVYYSKKDTSDLSVTFNTKQGCSYTFKYNNIIDLGTPSNLNITTSKNTVCYGEKFTLTAQNYRNIGDVVWLFSGASYTKDATSGQKIGVKLYDTGFINVSLLENNKGCISRVDKFKIARSNGPIANFNTLMQNYCSAPDTLQFQNITVKMIGGTTSYQWHLFENTQTTPISSATTTDHKYITSKIADYSAMLIAKGSNGCNDTMYKAKTVLGGKINKNLNFSPNPACPGQTVTFVPGAGFGGTLWPNYYKWAIFRPNGTLLNSSSSVEPRFTFPVDGKYSVKLKVWNGKNCSDSSHLKDTITIIKPVVTINISDTLLCRNQVTKIYADVANRRSTAKGKWIVSYVDSSGKQDDGYELDTIYLKFNLIGRYQVRYEYVDTTPGGCSIIQYAKNRLKVSGTVFKISSAVTQGCDPLVIAPTSKFISSVNYNNSSTSKTYFWYSVPYGFANFNNQNILSPTISCPRGRSDIYLKYNNGSGCVDSAGPIEVESGVFSSFFSQNAKCAGKDIKLYNQSNFIANNFKWLCDTPGVVFKPNNVTKEPSVNMTRSGFFPIKLVATAPGGCKDTSTVVIYVEKVKADFIAPDSISFCAPKIVTFINTTQAGIASTWYFGDGDSAFTFGNTNVSHIYMRNRPRPGYTVKLVSSSGAGCIDSISKIGYIKIIGPTADFSMTNYFGCEKLNVKFKNNSIDYSKFYLDFGDGSVLDSSKFENHSYILTDRARPTQVFYPKLALYDSNGCFVLAQAKDSIIVLKNAEARNKFDSRYFLRGNTGCAPLLVNFTDISSYVQSVEWDFDNDGVIDQTGKRPPPWLYSKPGIYRPMNIAININGCRDTFYGDTIKVLDPPRPDFLMANDTACPNKNVWFRSTTTSAYPIKKLDWKFGDGISFTDTSSLPFTRYKFKSPFDHVVTLSVIDTMGCDAQMQHGIYIADTAGPPIPKINFITVQPDGNTVEFNWAEKLGNDFTAYHVFEDYIGYNKKYTTKNQKDTVYATFVGSSLRTTRVCYTYKTEDTCNILSKPASGHCTIALRDSLISPYNIGLYWSYYAYWANQLSHYNVYRRISGTGDTFKKIAEVDAASQKYIDSSLCDYIYCYYVQAVHRNKEFFSRSNIVCDKPIYMKPDQTVPTTLVSVIDNKTIDIRWDPYYRALRGSKYIIEKSENGLAGPYTFFRSVNGFKTIDTKVELDKKVYAYRVRFQDHCGNFSTEGVAQRMIALSDTQGTLGLQISWLPYLNWPLGVNHYILQYKSANKWTTISKLNGSRTDTSNVQITQFSADTVCFRVMAVREGKMTDTAISNWICEVPKSVIFLPTAFNPSERGTNKIYKAYPSYVINKKNDPQSRFEMRIYNRWGQQVFECFDFNEGWDGTFMGQPCQTGFYTVVVKALGFDGVPHRMNQMIYMLR